MSQHTNIEWCDASWPVIRGCSKVSEGCRNCWAIRDAHLHSGKLPPDETRPRVIEAHRKAAAHFQGLTRIENGRPNWTGAVRLDESILDWGLKWRKPKTIFVASSGDLLHESLSDETIMQVVGIIERCPQHTFQILTKRAARLARLWGASREYRDTWPQNVWLGVSCEHQKTADERIPLLLQTPAAVRFVSLEPLIEPIELDADWLYPRCPECGRHSRRGNYTCDFSDCGCGNLKGRPLIDWVIVGGESGPGARPMHPDWVRSIRDQSVAAGVPFFFKQWGEWFPVLQAHRSQPAWSVVHAGKFYLWEDGDISCKIGKKAAGRVLDGRTWDQMPEVKR